MGRSNRKLGFFVECLTLVFSAGVSNSSFAEAKREVIPLHVGGQAVPKEEKQELQKNCTAKREWYEFVNVPGDYKIDTVNRLIKKRMTVGKKLKASDCPDPQYREVFDYSNRVTLTGQWQRHVGIATFVYFPGGSGRYVSECLVADLKSGKTLELKQRLSPLGKKNLLELLMREEVTKSYTDSGMGAPSAAERFEMSQLCLSDRGILVKTFSASGRVLQEETNLSGSQIQSMFKLGVDFAGEIPIDVTAAPASSPIVSP